MADFSLTMHPSSEGDALVLHWGGAHHAVVDLGRKADYTAMRPWLVAAHGIELFVISHIDADHIEGAMPMVKEAVPPFQPGDVWFNGHEELAVAIARRRKLEALSVDQGNKLAAGITKFNWPWNIAYDKGPVSVDSKPMGAAVSLAGGATVTLLSPSDAELAKLGKIWTAEIDLASLAPGDADEAPPTPKGYESLGSTDVVTLAAEPFSADHSVPNGASIAFLVEYGAKRVLMGADAYPGRIAQSLSDLGYGAQNRLKLDLFKLCHHGSKANNSPALLQMLDCTRFAISTDGTKHNHPDAETIARILVNDPDRPKTFYFNAGRPADYLWNDAALQAKWHYTCVYPDTGMAGLEVAI